jgi:hypothetical protein
LAYAFAIRRALLLVVLIALTAGCGSAHRHATSSRPATGVVSGTLGIRGGTLHTGVGTECLCQAEAGTVRLASADGRRFRVDAGAAGLFSVRVPPGRYEIVGGLKPPYDWPMGSCNGLAGSGVHFDRKANTFYAVVRKNVSLQVVVVCRAL